MRGSGDLVRHQYCTYDLKFCSNPNILPRLRYCDIKTTQYFADFELWTEFYLNENLDVYLIDPSKVLDIHSDVGDKNVRMELGGDRADCMKSLFD